MTRTLLLPLLLLCAACWTGTAAEPVQAQGLGAEGAAAENAEERVEDTRRDTRREAAGQGPRGVFSARVGTSGRPAWTTETEPPLLAELLDGFREGTACATDANCTSPLRCASGRCVLPPAMRGVVTAGMVAVSFPEATSQETFWLEVAQSAREQSRGLMDRDWMAPGFGMLFPYEREQELSFWMHNTWIPLDIIFVNAEGIVVHVEAMAEPLTRTPRSSRRPARSVVELVGGEAARIGLEAGQRVEFRER